MYIGTDLISKTGLSEKLDKLDFTFSIHPDSIPYLDKYGILLNATEYTLYDVANVGIKTAISKLADTELSIGNISVEGRKINAEITFEDTAIDVNATVVMS